FALLRDDAPLEGHPEAMSADILLTRQRKGPLPNFRERAPVAHRFPTLPDRRASGPCVLVERLSPHPRDDAMHRSSVERPKRHLVAHARGAAVGPSSLDPAAATVEGNDAYFTRAEAAPAGLYVGPPRYGRIGPVVALDAPGRRACGALPCDGPGAAELAQ